jgi:chemotaxis protein MotB
VASDNLLFPRGDADLRPPALAILGKVAGLLKGIPNAITVEGHTCDLPISTERFPSNWELSAARACSVARYLVDKQGLDPKRLAAAGYGESRPVAPNDSEDGRVRNRRVNLVILAHAASEEQEGQKTESPASPAPSEGD